MALKNREPTELINLNVKETEGSSSNRSENSSEIKLDISRTPPNDSPLSSHHQHQHNQQPIPNLFPSSNIDRPNTNNIVAHQLFHNSSSRPADHQLHCQKLDQSSTIKEECFGSMFVGMEDQPGFWPCQCAWNTGERERERGGGEGSRGEMERQRERKRLLKDERRGRSGDLSEREGRGENGGVRAGREEERRERETRDDF
ncbi:hypothetical protein Tco_1040709 [Tanacetum coccineum]